MDNNALIRVGDLLEHLKYHCGSCKHCGEVVECILGTPTIDPESLRPHGRWIPFFDGEHIMPERYYRCSKCGRVERYREPYCHCGAKMDEEEAP